MMAAMCDTIRHRGPDDGGISTTGPTTLGNRRLAIIDLSADGHMPMSTPDGAVTITYNGEVYNFPALRTELEAAGHVFKSHTDTEVVLHAYLEYGQEFVSRLNGMFALAVWDARVSKLILARDQLGIKPLYYYHDENWFIFASEMRAFHAVRSLGLNFTIDTDAVNQYFIFGAFPAPTTPYQKVRKLQPGCLGVLKNGQFDVLKYWEFKYQQPLDGNEGDILDELDHRLRESVRMRLVSDVPVGAFLSGGIDSSCVAALAAREIGRDFKTFSIGHHDTNYDESQYASEVARHLGVEHKVLLIDDSDITKDIIQIMSGFDEPFSDHSAIPTYCLSRMARNEVTVALSGDGGDELFFGYKHLRLFANQLHEQEHPDHLGGGLADRFAGAVPRAAARPTVAAVKLLAGGPTAFTDSLERLRRHGSRDDWADMFVDDHARVPSRRRKALLRTVDTANETNLMRSMMLESIDRSPEERVSAIDIRNYLQNDILVKVDRMSMLNSLEVRIPFLDHTFVEFAARIPMALKHKNGEQKYLLRRYVKHLFGDAETAALINRPKQGFRFSIGRYLRVSLRDRIRQSLLSEEFLSEFSLRRKAVERELREFYDDDKGGKTVWMLFCMYLWWEAARQPQHIYAAH
mgnify:CR=1 FL=1